MPGAEPGAARSGLTGLTSAEAAQRLAKSGRNEIDREPATPAFVIFAAQFKSPVIWLLLAAAAVSGSLGELADAAAIGTIIVVNAIVGFLQEYRAERAVLALRSLTAPRARTLRDGRSADLPASDVVPGDILLLEAGDVVAADARLVEASRLSANEALLTGESTPSDKNTTAVPPESPIPDRRDTVFMGTSVANGTGKAEVTATGMRTELGKIAHLLATAAEGPTPLQVQLAGVSRMLLSICGGIVTVTAVAGILHGRAWLEVFMSAVSLAVAAVPEGLPAIVTIAMAIGVRLMARRHVLVRKLHSVETLGCATVICTDKTGTLTTGVMGVRELWGPDHRILLDAAAACCDAEIGKDGTTGIGDPTEVAILLAAAAQGIHRPEIEQARPRVAVIPFDTERKRMSIRRSDGKLYLKGAVEVTLALCTAGVADSERINTGWAGKGLRVIAVATGDGAGESGLTLVGLIGLADPPRPEAIAAVAAARKAGIKTVMITGDHPATANAIARELGIVADGDSAEDLVHARATPEDKLTIIKSWKDRGAVVAMTGDGVNDAPALREAHIGIAMGRTGTEVTREAADMVLTDDNFASIVAAVREGRGIFDNIRKALVYLLSGNAGELAVMLAAALAGFPLPLLPLHLLWINLATDGLPALALVTDPADADALDRPPRKPGDPIIGRREWKQILLTGVLQASVTLGVFIWALNTRDLAEARSLAFSALVFGELFRALTARSATRVLWEVGVLGNLRLLGVVLCSVVVQIGLHQFQATRSLFHLSAHSWTDVGLCLLIGLVPVTAIELAKLAGRRFRKNE